MNHMKFQNLKPDNKLRSELDDAYERVMSSGRYISGSEVEAFEKEWSEYNGASYCVSCASGLDALRLVLETFDNTAVCVPGWTAPAVWYAVEAVGGICANINTDLAIKVHLYGEYDQRNCVTGTIIQDCSQAHGLKVKHGICCWSFYPTKNLGAYGDGGAITINDEALAQQLRELAHNFDSRLDPLQAAFLRVKLRHLDSWNKQRQEFAQYYLENLQRVVLPTSQWDKAVWHQFVIRSDKRDELKAHLARQGIETMIHYPQPPHRVLGYDYDYPEADKMAATVLSLPIAPHLTMADIKTVAQAVNEFNY